MIGSTRKPHAVLFFVLLLLSPGCKSPSQERHMFTSDQLQPVCMGRARMRLPAPATVSYSKAMLNSIKMTWQPMDPIGFKAAWQQRIAELTRSDEIIERQTSSMDQALAVSHTTLMKDPGFRSLEAWANYKDHILIAKADFGDDQDAVAQHWLAANLAGFHPDSLMRADGFCVPGGAVVVETSDETINAQIDSQAAPFADNPVLINISTEALTIPATPSLFERADSATARLMNLTGGVHTLRHGNRKVAGQTGQEVVTLQKGSRGFGINAQFEFVGLADRRDAPYLHMTLDGNFSSAVSSNQVLAVWDQALNSLTFVK